MQVLDDIWASIKGNAKTRINDPIIGAFVISWAFPDLIELIFFFSVFFFICCGMFAE